MLFIKGVFLSKKECNIGIYKQVGCKWQKETSTGLARHFQEAGFQAFLFELYMV